MEKATRLVSSNKLKERLNWLSDQPDQELKREIEKRAQDLYEVLQLQGKIEGNPWESLSIQEQGYFIVYVLAIRYKIELPEFAGIIN